MDQKCLVAKSNFELEAHGWSVQVRVRIGFLLGLTFGHGHMDCLKLVLLVLLKFI